MVSCVLESIVMRLEAPLSISIYIVSYNYSDCKTRGANTDLLVGTLSPELPLSHYHQWIPHLDIVAERLALILTVAGYVTVGMVTDPGFLLVILKKHWMLRSL